MDTSTDSEIDPRIRKKYRFSFDIVLVCLTFTVFALMGVVWYTYHTNTIAILTLSEDIINKVNQLVIQETTNYLLPARLMSELGSRVTCKNVESLINNPDLEKQIIDATDSHRPA